MQFTFRKSAYNFTSEDSDILAALVESADYKNNRVSYNAETVNLIQMDAKQVTQMLDDLLRTVQEEEHQQTMLNEMEKCEDE